MHAFALASRAKSFASAPGRHSKCGRAARTRLVPALAWLSWTLAALTIATPAVAIDWDGDFAVDGNHYGTFNVANNWNPDQVPTVGDVAIFNVNDSYFVTFTAGSHGSDEFHVQTGSVVFVSDDATRRDYSVNSGTASATINGGMLQIGTTFNPVFVDLSSAGSTITIGDGADGMVSVVGPLSKLNVLGTVNQRIGLAGATGNLKLDEGATADIATSGGALQVGVSSDAATEGYVNVTGGSLLNVGNLEIATDVSGASGQVSVDGGSTITQTLAGATLKVGGATTGLANLIIGDFVNDGAVFTTGSGDITVTDPAASIQIQSGGTFNANGNITLNGGRLNRTPSILMGAAPGVFNLAAGRTMTVQNGGDFTFNGNYTTAASAVYEITGAFSSMSTSGLNIRGGATINVSEAGTLQAGTQSLGIGDIGSSVGTLTADGSGTLVTGGLSFGSNWGQSGGQANVTFSNGAEGQFGNLNLAMGSAVGTSAMVNVLSGAELTAGRLNVATNGASATINIQGIGSSLLQGAVTTSIIGHASSGSVQINIGTTGSGATFTNISGGAFMLNATATVSIGSSSTTGTFDVESLMTLNGTINLAGGTMFARDTLTISPSSNFNFTGGTLHAVEIVGTLDNSGGTLEPGFSIGALSIDGDYTQSATSKLLIELGVDEFTFDTLHATGTATLAGELEIALGSYAPQLGNTFEILSADVDLDGMFSTSPGELPALSSGLQWAINYGADNVVLEVVAATGLLGDYNENDEIDAADYTVWRDALTAGASSLANDPTPDEVDESDFTYWRNHYGETLGAGAGSAAAVPEPSALAMFILAAPALLGHGRLRRVKLAACYDA